MPGPGVGCLWIPALRGSTLPWMVETWPGARVPFLAAKHLLHDSLRRGPAGFLRGVVPQWADRSCHASCEQKPTHMLS